MPNVNTKTKARKKPAAKKYSTRQAATPQKGRGAKLRRVLLSVAAVAVVAIAVFFLALRSDGQISIFENAVGSLFTPVQNAFRTATGRVKGFVTTWRNYNTLQTEYDALSMENEQLRMELVGAEEALQENERLKTLMDAQDTYDSLDPIYAKVIAREAGPWFETFSLNRGSSDGVSNGMAVVNGDGLIGRVYEVGLNYAKVRTIIDSRSGVACLMQRTRDNGVMRGQTVSSDSAASCYVYYLPNINNITPGDVVVTSGTDSQYPKGLKIGTVSALSLDAGSDGTYAVVTPSVDFQRIEEVFILRTVIETDTDVLAPVTTPKVEYQTKATPAPNAAGTVEATTNPQYWTRPTATPAVPQSDYGKYKVGDLIEDTWANAD